VLLEDKDAKIAELEDRVARLERLISRNSGNSSMPPSADDMPGRKPPERRQRRGGGRMHHVPVERCADIVASMSGIRPSDGWVHGLLDRAASAVAAANTAIRALIILARVICGDETMVRAGPGPKSRKRYLQVACTNLLTYYFLGDRDLASFKDFVYSDLHGTVIVHDRYQNYDSFDGIKSPALLPAPAPRP